MPITPLPQQRHIQANSIRSAFSLIELLAAIGIIAILATIIIPMIGEMRERAVTTETISKLKWTWQGMMLYAQDHNNRLPQGFRSDYTDSNGRTQVWQVQVGPYLYPEKDLSDYKWKQLLRNNEDTPIRDPAAPEDIGASPSLGINIHISPNYWDQWKGYLSAVPNPSNTILIGSRDASIGNSDYLYSLGNPRGQWCQPGFYHDNGTAAGFVFVDGHVEFLDKETLTYGSSAAAERPELWKWE